MVKEKEGTHTRVARSLREQGGYSHKDLKKQGRVPSGPPAVTVPTPPLQQEGKHPERE